MMLKDVFICNLEDLLFTQNSEKVQANSRQTFFCRLRLRYERQNGRQTEGKLRLV